MRRMPELTQLDSAKSTMRNLPPKYTAGLARLSVSCFRREPRPPASTSATALRTSWCGCVDGCGEALRVAAGMVSLLKYFGSVFELFCAGTIRPDRGPMPRWYLPCPDQTHHAYPLRQH